jgi:6-phospho-beta-glucosidase
VKIAIIGGAGARVPLLVDGLVRSDLPVSEVALFDIDAARLALVARVVARRHRDLRLCTGGLEACVDGADYVFTSIRPGGAEARARDEAVAMSHGIVGQETVGPAGFAMALRTIPPMVEYARAVARLAPRAWIVNFTNPVGMVTQAVAAAAGARIIGICDTPTELFEEIAHALGVPSAACHFDYLGLNHLGWVREVYHRGEPMLASLLAGPDDRLERLYRAPLFPPAFLRELGLLPTEYLYYYYRSSEAFEHVRRAGRGRGEVVARLTADLFTDLARPDVDPVARYQAYLEARDAGYFQIESGAAAPLARSPWAALTGYDKIALQVVRAIHFNTGAILPLDVLNRGNLPELEPDDSIEVPAVVTANGALPLHAGAVPPQVRDLLVRVKRYERLTVDAALRGGRDRRLDALAANPLVPSRETAERLLTDLGLA